MFNNFRSSIRRFLMASRRRLEIKIREDKVEIHKIREEKEKKIQKLEEEAMNQYISHFSIDRQEKVTTDDAFDASQFEVKFDENE